MASATSTVLVPGCFCTPSEMARVSLYQPAILSFWTPSTTWPRSLRRTGAPLRYAAITSPNCAAFTSCPFAFTV